MSPALHLSSLIVTWLAASLAAAEPPGDIAAVMGLSAADGSVRTQSSVRASVEPMEGADGVTDISRLVSASMREVRTCFAQAVNRDSAVQGTLLLRTRKAGVRLRVQVVSNATGDGALAGCVQGALSTEDARPVRSPRAGALVKLDFLNPLARLRIGQHRQPVPTRMLAGGRVRSEGGTQEGEVAFALETSAYTQAALEDLHRDLQSRLAGLLDCRRKASRRFRRVDASIAVRVSVDKSGRAHAAVRGETVRDTKVEACVERWVERAGEAPLSAVDAELALSFGR